MATLTAQKSNNIKDAESEYEDLFQEPTPTQNDLPHGMTDEEKQRRAKEKFDDAKEKLTQAQIDLATKQLEQKEYEADQAKLKDYNEQIQRAHAELKEKYAEQEALEEEIKRLKEKRRIEKENEEKIAKDLRKFEEERNTKQYNEKELEHNISKAKIEALKLEIKPFEKKIEDKKYEISYLEAEIENRARNTKTILEDRGITVDQTKNGYDLKPAYEAFLNKIEKIENQLAEAVKNMDIAEKVYGYRKAVYTKIKTTDWKDVGINLSTSVAIGLVASTFLTPVIGAAAYPLANAGVSVVTSFAQNTIKKWDKDISIIDNIKKTKDIFKDTIVNIDELKKGNWKMAVDDNDKKKTYKKAFYAAVSGAVIATVGIGFDYLSNSTDTPDISSAGTGNETSLKEATFVRAEAIPSDAVLKTPANDSAVQLVTLSEVTDIVELKVLGPDITTTEGGPSLPITDEKTGIITTPVKIEVISIPDTATAEAPAATPTSVEATPEAVPTPDATPATEEVKAKVEVTIEEAPQEDVPLPAEEAAPLPAPSEAFNWQNTDFDPKAFDNGGTWYLAEFLLEQHGIAADPTNGQIDTVMQKIHELNPSDEFNSRSIIDPTDTVNVPTASAIKAALKLG